ncbi:hypothetical protein A6A04_02100 [Paramagnetospirillum marisnigri]|uniref:Uncharacterized protein n=1 Tax=Paramagnetospirillum marisnigri TaxID=1285242 RepID=A0A178MNG3_9PROT|nr:hypothetical protein [Paramagnetospirillum marisnigri]OAN50219.1 hypothetical protein A6A04_02100 [Paramagnetospirillum marisnigri]
MTRSVTLTLGGKPLPIDLQGAWAEDDSQALVLGDGSVKFDFNLRQIRFAAQLEQARGAAHMKLVGDLGPMPFSAESPAARAGLARIVEAANAHLGSGCFRVVAGRVLVGGDIAIPVPVTAHALVTEVTRFLAPTLPYLEVIALYIRPPLAAARPGESAVRPEWRRLGLPGRGVSGWGR